MTTPTVRRQSNWYDLNRDGKRLEFIIKNMHTRSKNLDLNDPDQLSIYFAFIDRIIKATNSKVEIAESVLQIKQILQEARKSLPRPQIEVANPAQ